MSWASRLRTCCCKMILLDRVYSFNARITNGSNQRINEWIGDCYRKKKNKNMSKYFTKWWCNRVKQDDEFTRVRFWENLHPPFPKLNVKFWSMGLFTWALLTGLAWFPRSRLTSKFFVKFSMCSYFRGRADSAIEFAVFATEISVSGPEILPYEHFSPVTKMNSGGPDGIILHYLLYFPLRKHPIQLQWYSFKSCRSYNRREIFVFRHVCFVSRIWRQNSSPGTLAFSHLGNRAEISHMSPRQNSSRLLSQLSQLGSCEEALMRTRLMPYNSVTNGCVKAARLFDNKTAWLLGREL